MQPRMPVKARRRCRRTRERWGDDLTLVFDAAPDATSGKTPPKSAFTVTVDGASIGIGSVNVIAASRWVTLQGLSPTIKRGQTVTVSYADPTSGDAAAAI